MAAFLTIVATSFMNFIHCLRQKKFSCCSENRQQKTLSFHDRNKKNSNFIVHRVFRRESGFRDANGFCHCSKIAAFNVKGKVLMSPRQYKNGNEKRGLGKVTQCFDESFVNIFVKINLGKTTFREARKWLCILPKWTKIKENEFIKMKTIRPCSHLIISCIYCALSRLSCLLFIVARCSYHMQYTYSTQDVRVKLYALTFSLIKVMLFYLSVGHNKHEIIIFINIWTDYVCIHNSACL